MKQFPLFIVAIFILFTTTVLAQDSIQVDTLSNVADSITAIENSAPEKVIDVATTLTETQVKTIIPSQGF